MTQPTTDVYEQLLKFIEDEFKTAPHTFLNLNDLLIKFNAIMKRENPSFKPPPNVTSIRISNIFITGHAPIFKVEGMQRRANAVYRLQIPVLEQYQEQFKVYGATFNHCNRMVEFNFLNFKLGPPSRGTVIEYLKEVSSNCSETFTHVTLAQKYYNSITSKMIGPVRMMDLIARFRDVLATIHSERNLDDNSLVKICMMTATRVEGALEKRLKNVMYQIDVNKRITSYKPKRQNVIIRKSYDTPNNEQPRQAPSPVRNRKPKSDRSKIALDFRSEQNLTKIEAEFKSYLTFLKNFSAYTASPFTYEEIVANYYSPENQLTTNLVDLRKKIVKFNLNIVNTVGIRMDAMIRMLFVTQIRIDEPFFRRIQEFDKHAKLDKNRRLVKFSALGTHLERENESIQSFNEDPVLNPLPWGIAELNKLLQFVSSKLVHVKGFLSLEDVCSGFKNNSMQRRSVKQLVSKVTQHLKALPHTIGMDSHLKIQALYWFQIQVSHQTLKKSPEMFQYQHDGKKLVHLKQGDSILGKWNEVLPLWRSKRSLQSTKNEEMKRNPIEQSEMSGDGPELNEACDHEKLEPTHDNAKKCNNELEGVASKPLQSQEDVHVEVEEFQSGQSFDASSNANEFIEYDDVDIASGHNDVHVSPTSNHGNEKIDDFEDVEVSKPTSSEPVAKTDDKGKVQLKRKLSTTEKIETVSNKRKCVEDSGSNLEELENENVITSQEALGYLQQFVESFDFVEFSDNVRNAILRTGKEDTVCVVSLVACFRQLLLSLDDNLFQKADPDISLSLSKVISYVIELIAHFNWPELADVKKEFVEFGEDAEKFKATIRIDMLKRILKIFFDGFISSMRQFVNTATVEVSTSKQEMEIKEYINEFFGILISMDREITDDEDLAEEFAAWMKEENNLGPFRKEYLVQQIRKVQNEIEERRELESEDMEHAEDSDEDVAGPEENPEQDHDRLEPQKLNPADGNEELATLMNEFLRNLFYEDSGDVLGDEQLAVEFAMWMETNELGPFDENCLVQRLREARNAFVEDHNIGNEERNRMQLLTGCTREEAMAPGKMRLEKLKKSCGMPSTSSVMRSVPKKTMKRSAGKPLNGTESKRAKGASMSVASKDQERLSRILKERMDARAATEENEIYYVFLENISRNGTLITFDELVVQFLNAHPGYDTRENVLEKLNRYSNEAIIQNFVYIVRVSIAFMIQKPVTSQMLQIFREEGDIKLSKQNRTIVSFISSDLELERPLKPGEKPETYLQINPALEQFQEFLEVWNLEDIYSVLMRIKYRLRAKISMINVGFLVKNFNMSIDCLDSEWNENVDKKISFPLANVIKLMHKLVQYLNLDALNREKERLAGMFEKAMKIKFKIRKDIVKTILEYLFSVFFLSITY